MTLTNEQLAEIRERDALAAAKGRLLITAAADRRKLLKDREAIAERLLDIAEVMRGMNFARGLLGQNHDDTTQVEQDLRTLVNEMEVRDGD